MDVLSAVPAIPVRLYGANFSDLVAGLVAIAALLLAVAALVWFARTTGPHHRPH